MVASGSVDDIRAKYMQQSAGETAKDDDDDETNQAVFDRIQA